MSSHRSPGSPLLRLAGEAAQRTLARAALTLLALLGACSPLVEAAGESSNAAAEAARPGPFAVGVRRLVLTDPSREDPLTGGHRAFVTEVWYPAAESARGGKTVSFFEFFEPHREAGEMFVRHFGGDPEAIERRFRSLAVRDAERREGRFPLLVFSHGNGGVRHQNIQQLDHLASHGYIIATPDHTGNCGVTVIDDKIIQYDRGGRQRAMVDRPRDCSYIIDHLLAESARAEGWLAGAIDPERIGVLGHSFGGLTSCQMAASDPRVKAILPMTLGAMKTTSIPVLLMLGEEDRTLQKVGNVASISYLMSCTGPRHLLVLKRGGHFTYSDMDVINPEFGDGIGKDKKGDPPFEYLPSSLAKEIINVYSVAFFDHYLRGDAKAGALLRSNVYPDEVELREEKGLAAAPQDAGPPAVASPAVAAPASPAGAALAQPAPSQGDASAGAPAKRRVLLVTGDDVPAHDWRTTTPATRKILEDSGRFEVFVTEDPALLESSSSLARYDLVLLNYRNNPNGSPLSEAARRNLLEHVRSGKGLAALHFAVNAWGDWEEYAKLIGRIWIGRRAGEKVSGHGPRGAFRVSVSKEEAGIAHGIEDFETSDELYSRLVGETPIRVLATAYSADYSQRNEPMAWTLDYGKGRVYVNVLGHDAAAREIEGFRKLLVAGCLWAAGETP